MTTALFYLMLYPLPRRYSFDHSVAKPKPTNPQSLAFWRRVLRVHLCLIYFSSGLAKFLGNGWWDGANLWRSLIRPPFDLVSPEPGGQLAFPVRAGEHRRLRQLPGNKHSHQSYRIRTR